MVKAVDGHSLPLSNWWIRSCWLWGMWACVLRFMVYVSIAELMFLLNCFSSKCCASNKFWYWVLFYLLCGCRKFILFKLAFVVYHYWEKLEMANCAHESEIIVTWPLETCSFILGCLVESRNCCRFLSMDNVSLEEGGCHQMYVDALLCWIDIHGFYVCALVFMLQYTIGSFSVEGTQLCNFDQFHRCMNFNSNQIPFIHYFNMHIHEPFFDKRWTLITYHPSNNHENHMHPSIVKNVLFFWMN